MHQSNACCLAYVEDQAILQHLVSDASQLQRLVRSCSPEQTLAWLKGVMQSEPASVECKAVQGTTTLLPFCPVDDASCAVHSGFNTSCVL